jgi:hyperosmotically inducible protein
LIELIKFATAVALVFPAFFGSLAEAQKSSQPPARFTERVQKEVIHKILMLPNYDVFDSISFKVDGYNVVLLGYVSQPYLKSDAEHAVKKIEGVEKVENRIEVLPVSPNDDRLRLQLFRAIYRYGPLQRYSLPPIKPIRIIVNRGHVLLEGVVDSEMDRNLANIRANQVPGVFSVDNNLAVPAKKSKK